MRASAQMARPAAARPASCKVGGRATGFCRGCVGGKVALVHREVLRAAQVPSMSNGLAAGGSGLAVAAVAAGQMRAAQVARESAGMLHDAPHYSSLQHCVAMPAVQLAIKLRYLHSVTYSI